MKRIYQLTVVLNVAFFAAAMAQNGLSWRLTTEFPGGYKTGIALLNESIVMVSLKNGVIKSTNKGETFQQVLASGDTYCIHADSQGNVFVGGRGVVYISSDEGCHWDSVQVDTNIPIKMFVEHPDSGVYAITNELNSENEYVGDGVFHSSDNGVTWKRKSNGLNQGAICERIATDRFGNLYVAVADDNITGAGGLYISKNAGNSWQQHPVLVDGRGVINNNVKIQYNHGLSVSPHDTLYYSFEGSSGGYVSLNIKIAIQDLLDDKIWRIYTADNLSVWYMNPPLQNQFFMSNKSVFSSTKGTLNQGKSFVKHNGNAFWEKFDAGLGLGETGFRETQYFIEVKNTILMIQEIDERIYQMPLKEDSTLVSIPEISIPEFRIWPNPAVAGSRIYYSEKKSDVGPLSIALYSLRGDLISFINCENDCQSIYAPEKPGMYLLKFRHNGQNGVAKLIVH